MKIYVDDSGGKDSFFISVPLSDREAISFNGTLEQEPRIIKQVLVEEKAMPQDQSLTMEWDTFVIEDGKLVDKEHVRWVDQGKKNWCNNEVWETVWEKPISADLIKRLRDYSNFIYKHHSELEKHKEEMGEFEKLLIQEVAKSQK